MVGHVGFFEGTLTRGDVDAGYGDRRLLQNVQDGPKRVPHSPFEAEAKDGVYDHVVHLIDDFSLQTNSTVNTQKHEAQNDQ